MLTDAAMIRACDGVSCQFMTVGEAKALEPVAVESVEEIKGETEVVKALTPAMATMSQSLKSLAEQKEVRDNYLQNFYTCTLGYCKTSPL